MPAQWLALQAVAHQSKHPLNPLRMSVRPTPDKSASPLPVQTPLTPVPTRQQRSSVAASNPRDFTRRPAAGHCQPPLVAVPLIPPPQPAAARHSARMHFGASSWWLATSPRSASASSARNPAPHCYVMLLANSRRRNPLTQRRRPVAPLLHGSAAANSPSVCFLSFPTSSRLLLGASAFL